MTRTTLIAPALALAAAVRGVAAARGRPALDDPSFAAFLPCFEEATRRLTRGDPTLWLRHVSRAEDGVIMGAWGAWKRGWREVFARCGWAAARLAYAGAELDIEYLAAEAEGDLAHTVEIERARVHLAGHEKALPVMAPRITRVFRREEGAWRVVLRHANPLSKAAPEATLGR